MKTRIISILLAVCLIFGLLPVGVLAASATSGSCGKNATWSYNAATKTLSISGSGDMTDYETDPAMGIENAPPWDDYREEIEHVIINEGIASIGAEAFGFQYTSNCYSNLSSVSIAPTVTKIGSCAFTNAEKLKSIDLPNVTSIGYAAFNGTGIQSLMLPSTLETFEYEDSRGFLSCGNLQSITVDPGNQKYRSVDGVLFAGNKLLRYPAGKAGNIYTVPSGTTWIATSAFADNENITTISIPSSVSKIDSLAFEQCSKLAKITIAEGVTRVASDAFWGTALTSIVLPASVNDFTTNWGTEPDVDYLNRTFYFTGTESPEFDTYCCNVWSGYKVVICYPENATGWDAVRQQDNVKYQVEAGVLEFKTGTPPTEPSDPTDELKLVSTSPASDATVTEDDSLVLTFNQELSKNLNWTKGSIYIKNYNTDETALKIDSAKFYALGGTVNGKTLTVPGVFVGLRTGKYYVSVDADVITNASGKTFAGIKKGTLSFAVVFSPYDTNWVWGKDNYRFLNNSSVFGSTYYIKDSDLNDFLSALDNTEIKEVASSWAIGESEQEQVRNLKANHLIDWSGSCYGMALTAAIFKAGILEPDNYGGDTTHDIKMNTDIRSFINIFQISQNVGAAMRYSLETVNKGQIEETLASMWKRACNIGTSEKQSEPFLVRLRYQSSDESWGHAVVCYGAEEGFFSYTVKNDNTYSFTKRLLIADPNKKEETYIYISDDNRFAIYSAYPEVNAFGQREATLDELRNVTHWDVDVTTIILNIGSSDKVRVTANGGNAVVQNGHILSTDGLDISVNLRDIGAGNSAGSSAYSYILRGDADRVTLSTVDDDKLNADIQIGKYSVSVDGTLDSLTAGKNGTVNIEDAKDAIQLDLAINDADFDFVSISGKADGDTTLSVTSNAVTVSGEIADMDFTNMNRQTETSTAVVHGDLDAKFTLKNDTVVAAVDKDHDGIFETTLDSDTAQHRFKYVINTDGTHTARCTLCDKTITENHVFVNGVCVCGARKTSGSIDDSSHGSTRPITNNRISFTDVSKTDYFYDAVLWAVENGITTGTSRTRFSPYATCTRAQAVTFLWRASGSPAPKNSRMPFTDVSHSAYYYDAVLWALEEGITTGTSSTTFSPDAVIDRAQAVTFLHRANGAPSVTGRTVFTDVPQTTYYADAVKWAVDHEITTGTSAAAFSPNASCTRAQIVTFLYRAYRG